MNKIYLKTNSSKKTKAIAKLLAQEILWKNIKMKSALVLALSGDLGSGKTTFVQGFMKGVGIKKKIISPTFVLMKKFKIPVSAGRAVRLKFKKYIYHFDCYRLKKSEKISNLGLSEILENPDNIVLIEWPEKIKKHLLKNHILIKFKHGRKENERIIIIK